MKPCLAVVLVFLMLAAAACSGRSADSPADPPGSSAPAGQSMLDLPQLTAALPALDELPEIPRISSAGPADYFRKGSELANPAYKENAIPLGDSLIMAPDWNPGALPPTFELSWGIYGYHLPGYDRSAQLDLSWVTKPDNSNYYVAASDYGSGRWKWLPGNAEDSFDFGSLDGYFSGSDIIYFCVLLTGTGSFELSQLRLGGNFAPTASFTVDQDSGQYFFTTGFNASASTDLDGSIVSYQWAFEDPVYYEPFELGPTPIHKYDHVGSYTCTLRVVDNEGGTDEATAAISVTGLVGNLKPTAVLNASSSGGVLPLAIIFDGYGSTDPDDIVETYRFDLDGDGYHEVSGPFPEAYREFIAAGSYEISLMVIDAFGASDTDSRTITMTGVSGTNPPTAVLSLDYYCLSTNQQRALDTSACSDPDNDIVKYEWDFEGDGIFDYDYGLYSGGEVTYTLPGEFEPTLRITDSGGRQSTASLHVLVSDLVGYQESEPNDISDAADSLGGFLNYARHVQDWQGHIDPADSEDWYVFAADRATEISLWIDFLDAQADLDLELYAEADLLAPIAGSSGSGDREYIHLLLPAPGTYYLRVLNPPAALQKGPADYILYCLENLLPSADLQGTPTTGLVPFIINFDASASADPDGEIWNYDYDMDGDGVFEVLDTYDPFYIGTVNTLGTFNVAVRVTDNVGETAIAYLSVTGS